jgi:hypothetical protein
MAKLRKLQDETVRQHKRTTDALRSRIARLERALKKGLPAGWQPSR